MTLLRSIAMAFSMFSIVPMPRIEWNPKSMRYSLAAFPLIGVTVGLLLWGWVSLCALLDLKSAIRALGLVLIPLAVSGGIHMDGFADTVDAIASRAEPNRRRQILKDSNIGAFAGMGIASYLIIQFAIAMELEITAPSLACICISPTLGRTISGMASIAFPGSSKTGLLGTFRESSDKRPAFIALAMMFVLLVVLLGIFAGWSAAVGALCIAVLVSAFVYRMATKRFGGMSGDIAGYLLQLIELAYLVLAFAVGRMWI